VLVGHSYGGLVARLYASTYPAEVAGLGPGRRLARRREVPDARAMGGLPATARQQPAELAAYRDLETVDLAASAAQVREAAAAAPLRPLPLVVLTRVRPLDLPPDLPPGFSAAALERAWAAGQAELAALAPGARQVVATESGHGIQQDQPELVIAAIRQVVEGVCDPGTWATPQATPAGE
jgi:pimeloyl-ACP methyl ester carboxylesterase